MKKAVQRINSLTDAEMVARRHSLRKSLSTALACGQGSPVSFGQLIGLTVMWSSFDAIT